MPQPPQPPPRGGHQYKAGHHRVDLEAGNGGEHVEKPTLDAGRAKSSSARHLRSASETTAASSRRRASSISGNIIAAAQQAVPGDYIAPVPHSLSAPPHRPSKFAERCLEEGTQALMLLTVLALLTGGLAGFRYVHEHSADRPTQIHLAQGVDPSEMMVSFVTQKGSAPYVQYGTSDKALNQRSASSAATTTQYSFVTYSYDNYTSPRIHHVKLHDLHPDTTYYYVLKDEREPIISPVLQFTTMPAVGSHPSPLTFGVLADLGTTNDSVSTLQHVRDNPDLRMILHAGDLSYADCRGHVWDDYGVMTQPVASTRPWMVGVGNHEIEQQPGTSDLYVPFEQRYRMPWVKPAQFGDILEQSYEKGTTNKKRCTPSVFSSYYDYGNSFFSFKTGLVHVIYLNPYTPTEPSSRQYQWLSQDLSTVDRSLTPWVLVLTHCPLYSSNAVHYAETQTVRMRAHMEPLFYQHKVNLVITGHVHAYERTHPVYLNQTMDDGVVYVTIGDGGNYEGHAAKYHPQPDWSSYRNGTQYGHASFTIINTTHSLWQWHRNVDSKRVTRDEAYVCNSATHGRTVC